MKIILQFFFLLFVQLSMNAQIYSVKVYSGILANHSQRLLNNTSGSNDNYYFSELYGFDFSLVKNRTGVELGAYTSTFANKFNLRGTLLFPFSEKNFYFKIKVYNFNLGIINTIYNHNNYKIGFNLGLDVSVTKGNNLPDNPPIRNTIQDSIIYESNRYAIRLSNFQMGESELSLGIYFGVSNLFPINENFDIFCDLYGRMGFAQYFKLYHSYHLSSKGSKGFDSFAYTTNKGDILGLKLGICYKLND